MSGTGRAGKGGRGRVNALTAAVCVAFVGGMVGASFAAVPLYKIFCQVTGYGGTTQRVEQVSDRILDREITVRFDANTNSALPWDFRPDQNTATMPIGQTVQIGYSATNKAATETRGRASFNVTPQAAGAYFNKLECFCFSDQTLKAGETLEMPVVFYIDPDIVNVPELKDIKTITLSYTFFPIEGEKPVAEASPGVTAQEPKLGG
jgi:cytochrome c oxidase assembly protein subunit 11